MTPQCFVPSKAEGLLRRDVELIGRLHYKEGHDLYHWRGGWFTLEGSALHFSSGDEAAQEEVLQLKQLQELSKRSFSTHVCAYVVPVCHRLCNIDFSANNI